MSKPVSDGTPDPHVGVAGPAHPRADRPPRLLRAAAIATLLVGAAAVAGLVPRARERATLAAETRELAISTVLVVSPAQAKAPAGLSMSAEVRPWIEAAVRARATGYVRRWHVDLGAHIEAGQLLAEIEAPEIEQELARSRHEVTQAEAGVALAKITTERHARLLENGLVSQQDAAEKSSDHALKTAAAAASRANVRRLEELRAFGRITAPFSGVVTARSVDVGELVSAGSGKDLFHLAQTDRLRVHVRVPQSEAPSIALGQAAELVVAERPGRTFAATVARTAGAIAPDSRTLLVELEVDNAKGELLPGSFAQVRFTARPTSSTLLTLPGNTLLFRAEGPQIGVVSPDGAVELRAVKLGRDLGDTVEILSGAGPSDRVIVNPSDSLAAGVVVRVAAPAAKEKPSAR
jgi:RND family efflux transporter MFP subunit